MVAVFASDYADLCVLFDGTCEFSIADTRSDFDFGEIERPVAGRPCEWSVGEACGAVASAVRWQWCMPQVRLDEVWQQALEHRATSHKFPTDPEPPTVPLHLQYPTGTSAPRRPPPARRLPCAQYSTSWMCLTDTRSVTKQAHPRCRIMHVTYLITVSGLERRKWASKRPAAQCSYLYFLNN